MLVGERDGEEREERREEKRREEKRREEKREEKREERREKIHQTSKCVNSLCVVQKRVIVSWLTNSPAHQLSLDR
ncbi:hypothetical protein BGAL_0411g00010 [Botrytis galanthina]|uniref:Uncharacterized protein n=1 Tax=Botrytis galanthina TaxID=278940 RepID=A0A4S8QMH8_9HELO|nr:hypothetical protein BGAL_0411g00010 [Botrytis galanthina]